MLDKIPVSAIISDDNNIEWTTIALIGSDQQPVLPVLGSYPNAHYIALNSDYHLDDIRLEGGPCQLKVTAFDGTLTASAYVTVFIAEVPRMLDRMILLTRDDTVVNVWSEKQGSREWMFAIHSDYAGSAVSSWYQQLYFTGNQRINLSCYSLTDLMPEWTEPPGTDPPFHHPGNLFVGDRMIYASHRLGYIRGYDPAGLIKFATPFSQQIEPAAMIELGDLLIADIQEKSGHDRFIACYYLASGDERCRVKTGVEVTSFHKHDQESVFVLGNSDQKGHIMIYHTENNQLWSPHSFQDGNIMAGVAIDGSTVLIAGETAVYTYHYHNNSLNVFSPGCQVKALLYDDIQKQVYLVSKDVVTSCAYPSAQVTGQWTSDEEILNVHLLYNK